ncbi:MBL fold metallo-hydrolase [Bhargavaea ullalensis]|uniref:Glyoxylase-like metal-dependent hydrolase (Beta-lactamase superfamily II) n=1 Tax=Bhargavaea ullalensis TaxID=1265685 RepID=A0ABV2G909_9BACL
MIKFHAIALGPVQANCYIAEAENGECLIFDPGGEPERLIGELGKMGLRPSAVYLTHAHFDHIGALEGIRDEYGIPAHLHEEEKAWLSDPMQNGSGRYPGLPQIRMAGPEGVLSGEQEHEAGPFRFRTLHVPGHSPGSVAYYFPDEGVAVAGDALFKGSIGRTDLPGGDHGKLIRSIHDKLLTLPEETVVLPGHGGPTTIGDEMASNPFLNGFG